MPTSLFLLLLSLVSASGGHAAADASGAGRARSAADYLAETTWICRMPVTDAYEAHRCSPSPLTLPCTARWLSECEQRGGALQSCGPQECDDVYVGKRARRAKWEASRIRARRKARAKLRQDLTKNQRRAP